jgi:hypothetical protein
MSWITLQGCQNRCCATILAAKSTIYVNRKNTSRISAAEHMRRRWASMVVIEKGEKQRNTEATQPTGSIVGSGGDKHDIIRVRA